MDVFHDGTRTPVDEPEPCPRCDGIGFLVDGTTFNQITKTIREYFKFDECPDCHGTGYVQPEDEEIPY